MMEIKTETEDSAFFKSAYSVSFLFQYKKQLPFLSHYGTISLGDKQVSANRKHKKTNVFPADISGM